LNHSSVAECLCGAIRLKPVAVNKQFTACHCDICKKWGGIWVAVECNDVTTRGSEKIKVYDSSPWAERGFCQECGTHLYFKLKKRSSYFIPVGLFPETDNFEFERQIFIDRKPDYYCFSNHTLNMTEQEVIEAYSID
jgi:hypothetical protein